MRIISPHVGGGFGSKGLPRPSIVLAALAAKEVDRPVKVAMTRQQMFALVGHTGSGKSSIISLIARFYQPQHGRVLVDGHDIRQVTGESLLHDSAWYTLQTVPRTTVTR